MSFTVIGGSGFIGTKLISSLKNKKETVINIDKNPSALHNDVTTSADVRSMDALRKSVPAGSTVVLLAAEHRDDVDPVQLYYDVNVEGTANVLNVMREKGINSIIFTSTVAVYGLNKSEPRETDAVDPFNHYGKSKWHAEELLRQWYEEDKENRKLVIIRPTVVFGPGNRGNVYNLLKQIAVGRFLMIGKGNNKKSMAYVDNIVGFISYLLQQDAKGYFLYNYADKPDLSTKELLLEAEQSLQKKISSIQIPYAVGYMGGVCLDIVAKVSGKKFPISSIRIKKFCATTVFNADKAFQTGYKPICSLQDGLTFTINSITQDRKE
ncbi:nucleoside-diphosphate-sugar epimerase [Chitinophaga dinghuensis]|uniref:Nucleoside-diphosphate-sugar epimerase n=1 Tax=Chitinophaga dinghuensis TaxID=1539050 RepID=A0A327W8M0_9BACT|nr:NAD-dependent epimerase/dehydratase family protein [Chitinophaga dinghuensis]RAJ85818.1 nucleoside-diphosphate-sugar epimerase [Chitinophaga dinghuensis]